MKYIANKEIISSLKYLIEHDGKLNTFIGLVILIKNGEFIQDDYLVTDMFSFATDMDQMLGFSESPIERSFEEKWFTLFQSNWMEEVREHLLKGQKINLHHIAVICSWREPIENTNELISRFKSIFPEAFVASFFEESSIDIEFQEELAKKSEIYSAFEGDNANYTLSLDNGKFIAKTPGDLSGAPFSQTLYANKSLKKYFSVYDFDFLESYNLKKNSENFVRKKSKQVINHKNINFFAYFVFKHFYSKTWFEDVIKKSEGKELEFKGTPYTGFKYEKFTKLIAKFSEKQSEESLRSGTSNLLRYFEEPVFINQDGYYYFSTQWNANGDYPLSFENLKTHFESNFACSLYEKEGIFYLEETPSLIDATLLPKPFLLLAGISGTGKSRFVRKQAEQSRIDSSDNNLSIVAVRPDWHEPSDLLGYVSRIDGTRYIQTEVLKFIIDAWKAIAPSANAEGHGELNSSSPPYWLCLDEMNLAPVEQYFADYLSALESRTFNNGQYTCNALLDTTTLNTEGANIQSDLGLGEHQELWDFFCTNGIGIPPNLIVAGTVNMDETTHGFSRKVIDRAITLDFGEFFPNDFDLFLEDQPLPNTLTYSLEMQASKEGWQCAADEDRFKSTKFLKEVNSVLKNTPFELAYRALNELLLSVNAFSPETPEELQAVWDDFLMTKVLPRIDGDEDKLTIVVKSENLNLLDKLNEVLAKELDLIWGEDKKRVDLLRVNFDESSIEDIPCRSREKIKWMKERLDANTFTSYWP